MDYQFNNKTWSYLHYNQLSVSEEYPLTVVGFTGVGTDWIVHHNGMKFPTPDNDNDNTSTDCPGLFKSGWWYHNKWYHTNIN